MTDIDEIRTALLNETRESITAMLAMSWHHQWRARLRVPHIMDLREELMERWLRFHDSNDAAELIQIYLDHDLKAGDLPVDYDPDYAERMCRALMRSIEDVEERLMMRDLGLHQSPDLSFGETFRFP